MRKEEKLEWFRAAEDFTKLQFRDIQPDTKSTWLDHGDSNFDDLLPLVDKAVKAGHGDTAIFKLFSRGVESTRDDWVYDLDLGELKKKVNHMIERYAESTKSGRMEQGLKWSPSLELDYRAKREIKHEASNYRRSLYRPFNRQWHYSSRTWNHRLTDNHYQLFGQKLDQPNRAICFITGIAKPMSPLAHNGLVDMNCVSPAAGGTFMLGLNVYDETGIRCDNLTDWGLTQFTTHYGDTTIKKEDVFHYVYAVLHDPAYREKYKLNLKREFPRIPFYKDFWQWSKWGKELMDLHIGYESVEPYKLELVTSETKAEQKKQKKLIEDEAHEPQALYARQPKVKVKLKADKEAGIIELDELTLLKGIPREAWDYKLGNRSALEWVLDQYKEKTPKDPTIREKFNTYRFADHKEKVIDLLKRVCTVSVRTVEVVRGMEKTDR
ncbi:MAG: DNA methyltransferase [Flavobacteriales bacterium]|nr:DNA methyltransferase [Flavobacteriales bacterium]